MSEIPESSTSAPGTAQKPSVAELEGRIAALGALVKSLMTTLLLRGLVTRAEIAPMLADAEALISSSHGAAGRAELASVENDLPAYLRAAMGPPPDADDHDH